MFHHGQRQDDPHSDDNDEVVSVHEPVTASRVKNSFEVSNFTPVPVWWYQEDSHSEAALGGPS